ncbi:MAG: DNA repair protein RadC [Steroidobacterales bacterium]
MSIKDWPVSERPREKLLANGAQSLSDAELLAVLLGGSGRRGLDAVAMARGLLSRHRSLRGLLSAQRPHSLGAAGTGAAAAAGTPGTAGVTAVSLGTVGYCRLQAAVELARRHYAEAMRAGPPLDSPQATRDFLIRRLRDTPHELFCCLHLDNRHRLIAFDELFRGTIDGASVHPREVVKQALARNAAAVILAHNHPSGVAEPSQADELVTRRLREALQLVDIRVLDHLIVADNGCLSFAEHGLM